MVASQTDNFNITSSITVVTPQNDGDMITGAFPPVYTQGLLFLVNFNTTKNIILPFDHAGSDAGYRWLNLAGLDLTVGPGETAQYSFVPGQGWFFLKPAVL